MASLVVSIRTNKDTSKYKVANHKTLNINNIRTLLAGLMSGSLIGSIDIQASTANPVAAVGTVTITHANVTDTDTVTIGGVVITAATTGNGTTSWTIGANATADAVAMAACINANTTLSKYFLATSALGVVTLTAKLKGSIANLIAMSTSDATAFALVQLTGGTGGPEGTAETLGRM